jgi:hypothetical protein
MMAPNLSTGGEMKCAMKTEEPENTGDMPCKANTQPTCICICCFQYSAPAPVIEDFQFTISDISSKFTGFIALKWSNPPPPAPWQPPDIV